LTTSQQPGLVVAEAVVCRFFSLFFSFLFFESNSKWIGLPHWAASGAAQAAMHVNARTVLPTNISGTSAGM
jgi:hypothetical protein